MNEIAPALLERFRRVRLFAMDVDGVLTDGSIILAPNGEIKRFNVRDGLGLKRVANTGVHIVWITARASEAVRQRAEELGCVELLMAVEDKAAALVAVAGRTGVSMDETAYMGDDLNDLPALGLCGCPLAPADAVSEVRQVACYVTRAGGGHGAVREVCDLLLASKASRLATGDA